MNRCIWKNHASLLKSDHLKPAPCVSTKFLACLRVLISLALLTLTVCTLIETGRHDTSFQFISQWNLLAITILFVTMAIIQARHSRRLNTFRMEV